MLTSTQARSGDRPQADDHSLVTRLLAVTHFVQKQSMAQLSQSHRYGKLSLAYAGYISLLAEREHSPGELAERLGNSKQACSKTVRELETRGLISRRVNPLDSRSSMLSLSAKGIELLRVGVEAANGIQKPLTDAIGAQRLQSMLDSLDRLRVTLDIEWPADDTFENTVAAKTGSRPTRLAVVLPKLGQFFYRRLAASMSAKGYADPRPGIGQMLGMIGDQGQRLQTIAAMAGVSKQAAAASAAELDQLGYVNRVEDPADRRQIVVRLSPKGQSLLREAAASVAEVEAVIRAALGDADYRLLDEAMLMLHAISTEHYDTAGTLRSRIQQLSRQLVDELGVTGAHALARQLMTMTRGTC